MMPPLDPSLQNDTSAPVNEGEPPLNESARNAMRAYLQRTEVRLSTLHRIAVAFIGGAGLLLLLPTFFKEEITVLARIFIGSVLDEIARYGAQDLALRLVLYGALLFPLVLSLVIPLYALYLLLKDVVHFYFTIYTPGFPDTLVTPSFALSGVGFSPDESPEAKRRILAYQYQHTSAINFAIPFSPERRRAYLDDTIADTHGDIIPETRRRAAIEATGVLTYGIDMTTVDRFGAAFGLARTLDRNLVEEVATSEISLVRHIIYLRRMVLRYMKTLLMFIWTTLITFIMLPIVQTDGVPVFLILALGYFVWTLLVMPVMRLPLTWIYKHLHGIPDTTQIDKQLIILEEQVRPWIRAAMVSTAIAVALAGWLYLR
ncbi:MAG: hypothetical protein SGJ24_06945 [Chloroflexota bacterium]|nr:hypothetical protein [Chloroflexota bacterium]